MTRSCISMTMSSGDVFRDIGIELGERERQKVDIAVTICQRLEELRLTVTEAAEILGIDRAKVVAITRGRLGGFSVERLLGFAEDLAAQAQAQKARLEAIAKINAEARALGIDDD